MNLQKALLLLIYTLTTTTIIQTMEKKPPNPFYVNNSNSIVQIQSEVDNNKKYTKIIINNIAMGTINWEGRTVWDKKEKKNNGLMIKGISESGTLLSFIRINNNGEVTLMEPYLEMKITDNKKKNDDIFNVVHNANKTTSTINLNGNEIWDAIEITSFYHTSKGLQTCTIKLNHEN